MQRLLILGASWTLALLYAYPGMMSTDSVVQLLQARGLEPLGDWHPPVMAVLWRHVDRLISGPFGMLVLQTGALLFGLDALLQRVLRPRAAAVVAGLILLFPPILAPMGVIWKDSQMAGYLLAGTGLLMSPRWAKRALGSVLFLVATAMRYNAAAATLPIIVLLVDWGGTRWRRYLVAAAVWLAITVAAFGTNRVLAERQEHAWHSSLAIMDIVGTIRYVNSHAWPSDADYERVLEGTSLVVHRDIRKWCRWWYVPQMHWPMSHGEQRIFDPPTSDAQRDAIAKAWWRVVSAQPRAYLRHRWRVFEEVLGSSSDELMGPVWESFVEMPSQVPLVDAPTRHSSLQTRWLAANAWVATTFLFRPRFYLIVALALLCLARSRIALAIVASGVCYEASLFFVAPSADFRYSHWMIVCTVAGSIMVLASRLRRQAARVA